MSKPKPKPGLVHRSVDLQAKTSHSIALDGIKSTI